MLHFPLYLSFSFPTQVNIFRLRISNWKDLEKFSSFESSRETKRIKWLAPSFPDYAKADWLRSSPSLLPRHCSWPPVSVHWWSIIWLTYLFIWHLLLLPCTVSYPSCVHSSVVPEVSWTQEHPSFLLFNVPSCQRISYSLLGLF